MRFDRKRFFDSYRPAFGGSIAQLQVDGLEILLDKIESDPKWDSLPQVAYFLATIRHETGAVRNGVLQTYQPIKEVRGRPGTRIRRIQDKYWGTGFYGRGYCQITHRANYAKFGITETPEKALEPDTAYMIAARGMREGLFTGKRLSHYINDQEVDYHDARRIVNGLDKAELIAGYAQKFERILRASLVTDEVTDHSPQPEVKVESPSQPDQGEIKPQPPTSIQAIPPLPVKVPDWAKKIVGWGAGLNVGGLGVSFAFLRDNPAALNAMLNILKFGLIALGGIAFLVVIGVFLKAMWNAKLANDLNVARLHNYANKKTENVDFSGWKAAPDKSEVKL